MTRAEKAAFVLSTLRATYPSPPIPLQHEDPYTLLVAVVLSAQCTDKKVNEITPKLFARASDPQAMMKMDELEIQEIIRPCGLSAAKSKAIHRLSGIIVREHGGQVPQTFSALEALPGVGHKTASVVMVQAFGVPAFPVDTHIHRLAWRWTLSNGRSVSHTEADLKRVSPEEQWAVLHGQMMSCGREHCPAKAHYPRKCPICKEIGRRDLFR